MVKLNGAAEWRQPQTPGPRTTARQSSLRELNLATLARLVYAADEPPSRADLAARTGMSRATASRLVDQLVAGRLVGETAPERDGGPGRPAARLVPARSSVAAIGMEVTTSRLVARLVDLSGTLLVERVETVDLVDSRPAPALRRLGRMLTGLRSAAPRGTTLAGAALALPGLVGTDPDGRRRLLSAPNLGWADVVPAELLPGAAGEAPLWVGNEASMAAQAVARDRPGHAGPHRDFLYVSSEVGIGGAVVLDGATLPGRHGWAGEIGHVSVEPDGPPCRCGSTGCLERYAGRDALRRAAGLAADAPAVELAALAGAGHPGARTALDRAGRALGIALADAVNLLDIPTVVLGGDLSVLLEALRPVLQEELGRRVLAADWVSPALVAQSDDHLAATGAAYGVLQQVLADPAARLAAA